MNPRDAYPLLRDDAEHARLQAQARFWSDDAAALFASAGVGEGWEVADLGCGTLDVAHLLAQRVGSGGRVRALDNDPALISRIAGHAGAGMVANIRVEEGDAYDTRWPSATVHAAHARFLAAPAGRLDALVTEMARVVRPGGVVLLQEPESDTWSVPAAGSEWLALRDLIRAGFARRGGDFDAGRRLASALARRGLVRIEQRRVTRTVVTGHAYAELPLAFARQLRALWLQERLVGPDELERILQRVREALDADGWVTTFTLVQAWAWLPD